MTQPTFTGVRTVKLPVTDLTCSLEWYRRVFGARPVLEFPDEEGVVRGVACELPGTAVGLALRENAEVAKGIRGFDPVIWSVADRHQVESWMAHLDACDVPHSPLIEATLGYLLVFDDLNGIEHHVYSDEPHGQDHSDRVGYGRPVT